MSTYFFDLTDGERFPDDTGMELKSLADARAQAVVIMAGAVMPGSAAMRTLGDRWRIEVRERTGPVLFVLEYRAGDSLTPGD